MIVREAGRETGNGNAATAAFLMPLPQVKESCVRQAANLNFFYSWYINGGINMITFITMIVAISLMAIFMFCFVDLFLTVAVATTAFLFTFWFCEIIHKGLKAIVKKFKRNKKELD